MLCTVFVSCAHLCCRSRGDNMNTLVLFLVASLALASGKPFFPVVYHNVVPTQYAAPFAIQPQPHAIHPIVAPFAVIPENSVFHNRYHAQADDGSYSFGYSGGPSSRAETRDKFGNVQGAFNYVDANGKLQTQLYVADGLGFRVAATNLPRAPIAQLDHPKPVQETAEVKAARAQFEEAFNNVKSRSKRDADPSFFTATSYKSPASTSPVAPAVNPIVPFPVYTQTAGHQFPTNVFPTTYTAGEPFVTPFTYTAGHPFPTNVFPTVYKAGEPFVTPFTYTAGHPFPTNVFPTVYKAADPSETQNVALTGVPVQPVVYSLQPFFNFKEGKLTHTFHNPGVAHSYRVDT